MADSSGALVCLPAPERRQCSPSKQPAAKAELLFCPLRREISPLRSATVEMTIGVPANIVISSGAACRYGADGKRFDETLSRVISQRNAARIIRGGDFSTPLRFGRNDERGARQHRHLERGDASVWVLEGNRFDETLSREISQRNAARTIRGRDFSTPLRFGRNDERGARQHRHIERRCMSVRGRWEPLR